MIRPSSALLWLVAIGGTACGLAAAGWPWLFAPALLAMLFALLVILVDGLASASNRGSFNVTLREGGRQTKDHASALVLALEGTGLPARKMHFALVLPPSFETRQEIISARTEVGEWEAALRWEVRPRKRGKFTVGPLYVTSSSPLGLWERRRVVPAALEVRVYPNLLSERRRLAAIFMNRGLTGVHAQRRVGKGRDFEQLREYIAGDSYEDIHWKATARRLWPVTKIFQVERTQEVYVLVDSSRLSGRAVRTEVGGREAQVDRFIAASLILALVTQKQGDLFGLVTFSDRVHGFVRARTGREHFNLCRDTLYLLEPQPVNPDFEELFTFIRMRLRKRALLVVLTNLDDPALAEAFTRNARHLASKHLLLVHMISPRGATPIFDGAEPQDAEDVYRKLAGHLQWHGLRELQRELHRLGATMTLTDSAALAPELISQYVNVKQRQVL